MSKPNETGLAAGGVSEANVLVAALTIAAAVALTWWKIVPAVASLAGIR